MTRASASSGTWLTGRRSGGEEDDHDADELPRDHREHERARPPVDGEAEEPRRNAGRHCREEDRVREPLGEDPAPVHERDDPEAELERAQEAVVRREIRIRIVREGEVGEQGALRPREDERHRVAEEEHERRDPQERIRHQYAPASTAERKSNATRPNPAAEKTSSATANDIAIDAPSF